MNEKQNLYTRATKAYVATAIVLGSLLMGAGATLAAPADPGGTGAGLASVADGTEAWVENWGVPAIVTLLVIGVAVGLLIRYGKKTKNMV